MWTNLDRPPLNARSLQRALVDGPAATWSKVQVVDRTGSTNADLAARAAVLTDRTALIAEQQDSGRGRHSRPWTGPERAQILMSVFLELRGIDPASMGWLPLAIGSALVDTLKSVCEVDARLKWPNDVLIDGRKVAGILAEVAATNRPAVIVGIGLNVSLTEDELPVPTATSLALAGAVVVDRDILVRALLRNISAEIDAWRGDDWNIDGVGARYRTRCATLGQSVRVELPGDRILTGTAVSIDEQGRIVIAPTGAESDPIAVSAGDVTHLRPIDPDISGS